MEDKIRPFNLNELPQNVCINICFLEEIYMEFKKIN